MNYNADSPVIQTIFSFTFIDLCAQLWQGASNDPMDFLAETIQ
jgi:hypothetical protein